LRDIGKVLCSLSQANKNPANNQQILREVAAGETGNFCGRTGRARN